MFFKLFSMLNIGSNRVHLGGDHCWLTIFYVIFLLLLMEHVEENFGNFKKRHVNIMKTF